jgi:hypothetical protein
MVVFCAAAWARRDISGAMAWLREQPDDELKARLTASVAFEVAERNPNRALELADAIPVGRTRWLLYSSIAQTWVAVDTKAALAWAARLPEGPAREAAYAGVATGFGVPVARRRNTPPGLRSIASRGFGGSAAAPVPEANSPEFAAWLATQPGMLSREDAILEYVRQRGATDSGTIGQWLTTLPGDPVRDRAMKIYLENQLGSSPQEAARWLSTVPRSSASEELIEATARQWLRTNPEAAAAWLRETSLPAERKEWLLRQAGR